MEDTLYDTVLVSIHPDEITGAWDAALEVFEGKREEKSEDDLDALFSFQHNLFAPAELFTKFWETTEIHYQIEGYWTDFTEELAEHPNCPEDIRKQIQGS